jgi:hypothetical protein
LVSISLFSGLEQSVHRAGWQLGEGFIGGSEDGERSGTFQGVDQAGRFYRGDERGVVGGVDGVVDDVFGGVHGLSTDDGSFVGREGRACDGHDAQQQNCRLALHNVS